jgi:2-polyprenyl-6-methoxyphenol hydroxylase-like FAD-dependent oxidoreductase
MKEEEPATAVIAGGGIVGLTLAMAIKKQLGIFPEVYEKTSTFATEAGAGLGMYPNGLRVLRDISTDLLKDVCEAGHPYRYRRWERHDGVEIMSADESILTGEEDQPFKKFSTNMPSPMALRFTSTKHSNLL